MVVLYMEQPKPGLTTFDYTKNGTVAPRGLLATSHDGLFPDYNTLNLPMANPPPPFHHKEFAMKHETYKVDRFFSKLCYLFQNTKSDVNER